MSKMVIYANCFPVKGFARSIICDVTRYKYDFIPNSLYDFLTEYNGKDISSLRIALSVDQLEVLDSYIAFLQDKEYIFFTDQPELFPKVELSWESSSIITNAIIDFDIESNHDFKKIVAELNELRCQALEIRSFGALSIATIEKIIDQISNSAFRSVQLILKYHHSYTREYFKLLMKKNQRLMSIVIHSVNDLSLLNVDPENYNLFFVTNNIDSEAHCGAISNFNFASNITLFMESHFHNSCLNRKISVDRKGFIKNCPSMNEQYGHHSITKLNDVADLLSYKALWDITKDQISICKDCEFRYICTDCRAFTQDPQTNYAKPAKCSYDPYAGVWKSEKSRLLTMTE